MRRGAPRCRSFHRGHSLTGLHVRGSGELVAQRRYAPGQVRPDRSRLDPQLPGDGVSVQIKEDPQRDHLTLPGRQPPERGQQGGIEAAAEVAESRHVVVSQGQFAPPPPPPRRPGVKRGAHHPRLRGWMAADLPPRHPGLGERLRHLVFGRLRAADDRYHRAQAGLPAGPEELRELRLLVAHNPLTPTARRSAYLAAEIWHLLSDPDARYSDLGSDY